jgi:hypothetical protein
MQKSFSDLEAAAKKKLTRRDRFLAKIDEVTPWSQLHQLIEPFYPKAEGAGRPPVGLARMLRMYVAQQCFGLSDEGMDDAIYLKASVRAKVEHPFHAVKNLFHHRKARYRGLEKNTAQLFTLFGFANLVLAGRQFKVTESRTPS